LRERLGFTQEQAANELGLKRQAIIALEAGRREVNSFELFKLANLYGVSALELMQNNFAADGQVQAAMHLRSNHGLSPEDKKNLADFKKICEDYEFLKGLPL